MQEPPSIENDAHQKASVKKSSKLNKFLHSEVNLLIQHMTGMFGRVQQNLVRRCHPYL